MKASITNVCFLVAASLFGPVEMVRGANKGAVGYVNASISHRAQLIANPLSHRTNRIDQVLTWVPEGTKLVTFDGSNRLTNEYLQGAGTFTELTLPPAQCVRLF